MADKIATKDPPVPEGWKWQLSLKLGQHMLNVRADTFEEFRTSLGQMTDSPEMIVAALGSIEFEPPAPVYAAPAQPFQPPLAQTAPSASSGPQKGQEVGPITVTSIEEKQGISGPQSKTPGRPFTKYEVTFGNGALKASTFDTLVSGAAKNLIGKSVYARVETKGKWGNDLLNVRPAA